MGARRSFVRNTNQPTGRWPDAHSRRRPGPALGWLSSASPLSVVLALLLAAAARGATPARGIDLARPGVVSFYASRQLVLLDEQSDEVLSLPAASSVPHELEVSGDSQLFLIERSSVERIDLVDSTRRLRLRIHQPGHGVMSPDGSRTYISRASPPAVRAIRFDASIVTHASVTQWTVALPARAQALALEPAGQWLFAAYGSKADHIAVIDTAAGRVARQWTLGKPAAALRISHDGAKLYTLSRSAGQMSIIQVADGATLGVVQVGARPSAFAVAPDGTRLYVAEPRTKTLAVVAAADLRVAARIALPGRPFDVAVTPDGAYVVVSSPRRRAVFWVDAAGGQVVRVQFFRGRPWHIACGSGETGPPVATPTATAGAAEVTSPTPTSSPSPTSTPAPSNTPAATPTDTPSAPPGMVVGEVYDDSTAQPLAGVQVVVTASALTPYAAAPTPAAALSDAQGRYALPAAAGNRVLALTKDGYTRSMRRISVSPASASQPLDVRLTPRNAAVPVGSTGGTVAADIRFPHLLGEDEGTNAAPHIDLIIPPNVLPDGTPVQVTPLSAQGLIAPVPPGWSVLLGVDIQAAPASAPASAVFTLRVPLTLFTPADSLPVIIALWDDATRQWLGGPLPTLVGETLDMPLSVLDCPLSPPGCLFQFAFLVADTEPQAPPTPAPGTPLQGVLALQAPGASGSVLAQPAAVVTGSGAGAQVWLAVDSLAQPLSSGAVLRAALRETYDLRDGRTITGTVVTEDLIGYQISPTLPLSNRATSVGAYFRLVPSRDFGLSELATGRVDIHLSVADTAAGSVALIDNAGGTVSGPGGLHLVVPPNAATGGSLLTLLSAGPASPSTGSGQALPPGAGSRPDFVGAFTLQVDGAPLDPLAAYRLGFGQAVMDGQQFVIGRLAISDEGSTLVLAALGRGENGAIVLEPCPAGLGSCVGGLDGSGTYAVFTLPAVIAIVTGTVADRTGPRAGIVVQSDTEPVAGLTDASGHYALIIPTGVRSTLTARDAANDLSGTAAVSPASSLQSPVPIITQDLDLRPSPPQVVQINPANHASQVERSAAVTVTFSKPVDPASITAASVFLLQADSRITSTSHEVAEQRSLSTDGTQLVITPTDLLAPNALYQLTLTSDITDRHGNALSPRPPGDGQGEGAFVSTFTTAAIFKADALPPNTLRVSLPVDGQGNVIGTGTEIGKVFVCGGANLAGPGTAVVVQNATSQVTYTASATDANGVSGSEVCDVLFPGRCATAAPGAFCAMIDAALGDSVQVQVQDVLHNTATLDAGNMTDERTGATAIGPDGGRAVAVEDARYSAEVPAGAFDGVQVVTVFPIRDDEFPAHIDADAGIHHQGAVFLDLGDENVIAQQEISLSIPAPPHIDPDAQILVGQVINFRGRDELTLVDTGSYRVDRNGDAVLSTNSPPFPGPRRSGYYNFSTPDRSVGYVLGIVDKHLSTAAVIPSPLFFVFPYIEPELTKFAMPVLADEPATVSLQNVGGQVLDQVDIVGPPAGQFLSLPRPLSDDPTPVAFDGASIPNGETGIDTQRELDLTFSRAVNAGSDGRLAEGAIEVRDDRGNLVAGTWAVISPDGRRVRFFPLRPFPPGRTVGVTVVYVEDAAGNVFSGFASSFATFAPVPVASLPIASNDVDLLQLPGSSGTTRPVAVVARNGDSTSDSFGGIVSIDVRNARAPVVLGEALTPGTDRAVRVVTSSPPLVVSVDAAGHPQRYGTIRAFDFSDPAAPVEVGRRILNLSPQAISEQIFLQDIPADGGVPLAIALVGTDAAYVANPPVIGVQQVTLSRMIPPRNEIEGMLNGEFRVVAALRQFVLAAGQHNGTNEFLVLDATLSGVRDRLPLQVAPMDMTAIPSYPIDFDGDGNLGVAEDQDGDPTTAADEISDLVVMTCEPRTLCVLRLDASGTIIATAKLVLPASLGGTRGGAVDPQRRLLYLAAGTAGLAVVDFNDPLQAPSASDPVLAVVPLSGQAKRVRLYTDARGIEYALVATDESLEVVQVTPGEAGLSIYDTNNDAVIPERFEESDGTFILVNNDNDDADVDANGTPILDKDDVGRVEGEDDLRRLDIKVPMTDGVLTLDMASGAAQARLWLTADRDGAFPLPQWYDLAAGQRPPETVWIEGIAPSAADRDVRITFHWEPPQGSQLLPFDDAVTATVVELDYIPGRHPTGVYVDPEGERKTSFFRTKSAELHDILVGQGQPTLDDLPQANFGGVRIRGVDSSSIAEVTVRTADETSRHGAHAPILDETLPTDLTLVAGSAPRTLISREDLMVYTGVVDVGGAVLDPPEVRDRFRGNNALPVHTEAEVLANTAVLQRIVFRTPNLGKHPPLLGGGAGAAALAIIDAQAFASQISAGVRGSALYDEYLAFDAGGHENFAGMQGALADRWSRLIVQLVLPATDPHTSFDFHLMTDPPADQAKLGSNHLGDQDYPFGLLSLTGFEGFNTQEDAPIPGQCGSGGPTLDLLNVKVQKRNGRRAAVATFAPPASFPFNRDGADLIQLLNVSIGPSGTGEAWAKPSLLLVRPPVIFVHGLTGSPGAWGEKFVEKFDPAFVTDFVDYANQSVSGYDTIFSAVPRKIDELFQAFRTGHHSSFTVDQGGERGLHLPELDRKRIAATQVDAVGHSMGGLALRWFVSDALSQLPSQPRQIRYPLSAELVPNPLAGAAFPAVQTFRAPPFKFQQVSNFMRGSIRKIVTLASPQLGSPYGNYVTHEICADNRSCYTSTIPPRAGRVAALLGTLFGAIPSGASGAPDAGTAVYDLAQGSNAIEFLQKVRSDPVPVHALAVTENTPGNPQSPRLGAFEGLLIAVSGRPVLLDRYCPHLAGDNSDVVVPLASQLYGTGQHTVIHGFWHGAANQTPTVAAEVSDRLLYDRPGNAAVNSFDETFPSGMAVPLECN